MESSSVLCAFFEKRISDCLLLFSAFWSNVDTEDARFIEGQWQVPREWKERAERDGTLKSLKFLSYRINRVCALMGLVDCWSSSIGRHLAFWLDSHVHLIHRCERGRSGPVNDTCEEKSHLYLYDWRYVPDNSLNAIVRCLGGEPSQCASLRSHSFFSRVMHGVTTNKQLVNILRDFSGDHAVKKTVCSAVTRCFLGGMSETDAPTNSLKVRLQVHKLSAEGVDDYYDRICKETERQKRPITLICIREYVIKQVSKDLLLDVFLSSKEKWLAYANNTVSAAESLRTMFKAAKTSSEETHYSSILEWVGYEAPQSFFTGFCRSARRVPGLLSRDNANKLFFPEACKMIRKERDKKREDNSIVTERFHRPDVEGRAALNMCRSLSADETLPLRYIERLSGSEEAFSYFKTLITVLKQGKHKLQEFIAENSPHLGVAGDCLSAFQASCEVKSFKLPPEYNELQKKALRKRFDGDPVKIRRGCNLLCCLACSTIKNFTVGEKTKGNPMTSHGFKRVCHDGRRLMCDEKRLYACCKTVPLKEYALVDDRASRVIECYGKAYVITTCCGHVTPLLLTTPVEGSPLTCEACAKRDVAKPEIKPQEKCCYCEKKITKINKGYRGTFSLDDGEVVELSFCKRHTRSFMKKDFEPMRLREIKEAISTGRHI